MKNRTFTAFDHEIIFYWRGGTRRYDVEAVKVPLTSKSTYVDIGTFTKGQGDAIIRFLDAVESVRPTHRDTCKSLSHIVLARL